jgi:hypothetical protein
VTSTVAESLRRLTWSDDEVVLDDLVLRIQEPDGRDVPPGDDVLRFYKSKPMIDDYIAFFDSHPDLAPRRVFELGIWDGGSTALWYELFRPVKHVAVDLLPHGDSDGFRRYVDSRGAQGRIETHWATDQHDKARLDEIVRTSFDGPLDLVVDDASHLYEPTKASFETLFPLLAPGGFYVIEDWPWSFLARFRRADHPWSAETPLAQLVFDVVGALGGAPEIVKRLYVYYAFFVVERGPADVEAGSFSLEELSGRLL